ncbi:cobalamin biosynthetic protein CobC [Oceaniovalibus guishaninsula JLT2003]|uniref:Aminotransferase n=1 Tax=Oceaniovalibus guishaninsula JLT2003 TaxID=1231392 RepID=K2I5R0_9RHOB|nr:aminotransferase class I/II-fold pyridoxal phosphate-dependent enzyme [Oceaniovalibus guishaninsula]EKE44295.1 cobalamin biosynthetic protein CobC [Oceaniovalibus guishaninsula JLT2003]
MTRDHGGGIDAATARWGGARADWLDLSTGINPIPYPLPPLPPECWTALPDRAAQAALIEAARRFWTVPEGAGILAAPGASALIARIPLTAAGKRVTIPGPTYNEHAASFRAAGWQVAESGLSDAAVIVHPNNPDGRFHERPPDAPLTVIDESFCDIAPDRSHVAQATRPGVLVLKSFGKFWGLAGLRLGFAIGDPALLDRLADALGPWAVSGAALHVGTLALGDRQWAEDTRRRLADDARRLDALVVAAGAQVAGGTPLFRLYRTEDAADWKDRLARHQILGRTFPYSRTWLRLGLPSPEGFDRLARALT